MDLTSDGARRIEVAIDEIVLDGVAPGDPGVVTEIERVVAGSVSGADPAAVAAAVATAIGTEASR